MKEKETRNKTARNLCEEACVGKPKDGGKVCLLIHASGPLPEQEVLKSPFGPFARSKAPGEVHPRVVYVEALVHASLPSDGGLMPAVWWSNAT